MAESTPDPAVVLHGEVVPAWADPADNAVAVALTDAGAAALAAAEALAQKAAAPATLRAYKADWTHYAAWCAKMGFTPVPAEPRTVGAYLGSLAETHAPTTVRRRLSAIGKMHRFNDLAWNPAHRDIQGPLQGLLRTHGRPVRKAAALSLAMLRQLVATCDNSPRGRRDRALLLFGFAGAPRRAAPSWWRSRWGGRPICAKTYVSVLHAISRSSVDGGYTLVRGRDQRPPCVLDAMSPPTLDPRFVACNTASQ